jgi:ElaB/YqjD/DUF883 family membrane-anchored ribosome-binding protein
VDQVRRQAETEGSRLMGTARTRARSAFEHQQHRVADSIGSVAQALHQAADKLNEQNEDVVARYTDTAAQRIEQFANSLRDRNLDDLVGQAEQFARRQPEVFLGTAVATGFLIARFLRSSGSRASQRRSNLSYGGGDTGSYGSGSAGSYGSGSASTYGERGYGSYGGQNRYSQQGSERGTGYGGSGYTGGASSTGPAGTSGVSGTGAASGSTTGGSAALASSTTGTPASATGAGASALERNTGVVGTSEKAEKSSTSLGSAAGAMSAIPVGTATSSTTKPDDKGVGSTPPRGTNP